MRDTLLPNGHRYAITAWPDGYALQRQAGDSVFQIAPADSVEQLLYDFSRAPGDTIFRRARQYDTTSMVLAATGTMDVFGRNLRYWQFFKDIQPNVDNEMTITIVDSLGPYQFLPSFGPWDRLRGAKIAGRVFGTIISVEARDIPAKGFALLDNYPNPFNPRTVVSSRLPVASNVRLVVYDLLGREVAVLVNERRAAGVYHDSFDGSGLASGIYIYRLTAGQFSQARTMVLVK